MSPVRNRISGMPSTPSGVTTISPVCPGGSARPASSTISQTPRSGAACPPQRSAHSQKDVTISDDE